MMETKPSTGTKLDMQPGKALAAILAKVARHCATVVSDFGWDYSQCFYKDKKITQTTDRS